MSRMFGERLKKKNYIIFLVTFFLILDIAE